MTTTTYSLLIVIIANLIATICMKIYAKKQKAIHTKAMDEIRDGAIIRILSLYGYDGEFMIYTSSELLLKKRMKIISPDNSLIQSIYDMNGINILNYNSNERQ